MTWAEAFGTKRGTMSHLLLIAECVGLLAFVLLLLVMGIYKVGLYEAGVVTRLGRFHRVAVAGMHWKLPIDRLITTVDLRASKMNLKMATRTKDGVIITVPITIETRVNPGMVFEAWSQLPDPGQHVREQAEQVVLGRLRSLTLDELFASQTGIAGTLRQVLEVDLAPLGYEVVRVQVTGAVPNNLEDARRYLGRLVEAGQGPYGEDADQGRSRVA
jgi:regulator of protease activity HflC (stomatin/prohibitin superfamily)